MRTQEVVHVRGEDLLYPRSYQPLLSWMQGAGFDPLLVRAGSVAVRGDRISADVIRTSRDGGRIKVNWRRTQVMTRRITRRTQEPIPATPLGSAAAGMPTAHT